MMQDWQKVKEIFASAVELPFDARSRFLEENCGADILLLAEVESLLAAHEEPENLIEKNSFDLASNISTNGRGFAGKQFGHYTIEQEIGRGGMGAVFLAQRTDGEFEQQAALKIVRQTFANPEMEKHFRRERQILAGLNHPNIARLLDGGVSEMGEPFLVMEYVEGDDLIQYASENNLSLREKLRLFIKVCSAVSYAHRNLIIHRDIKPSNILVTKDGEPKLLDFGLAKAFAEASETQTAMRAFTPAYASPEQVQGANVTTASDVYSLGVILYELLSGAKPLDLDGKSYEEILQTIYSNDPVPPSHRPSMTDFENASGRLTEDLDKIALMALRKEPERRYGSVENLAGDIENYLAGRPVSARRNTFLYLAGKFVSRNRIAVGAACLIVVSLIAALGISLSQARIARREAERSEAVNQFLRNTLLTAAPGRLQGGRQGELATIVDVLNEVEKRLDADLSSEPEVRAELRALIGDVYLAQGRYDEADRNLNRAFREQSAIFGRDSLGTLQSEVSLAALYLAKADYDRSIDIYNRRFQTFTEEFKAGRIEPDFYIRRLSDFALIFRARGDAARAEVLWRQTVDEAAKIGSVVHVNAATTLLTLIMLDQGRFAEARSAQSGTVSRLRETLPADDPAVGSAMTLLGSIQLEDGDLDQAETNLTQAETIYRQNFGPDYMPLYDNIRLQAQVAYAKGNHALARERIGVALENYRKNSSPKYISFATALTIEGLILSKLGKSNEAEKTLREAVRLRNENLPAGHFMTALSKGALGEILLDAGKHAEAEPFIRESLESLTVSQESENGRLRLARERLRRLETATQKRSG